MTFLPSQLSKQTFILSGFAFFTTFLSFLNTSLADEETAREFLNDSISTSYLQRGDFRLERVPADENMPLGTIVFQKYIRDIPLHGGRVIVFEAVDGFVSEVFDDTSESLEIVFEAPKVSAAEATAQIESAVDLAIDSEAELVWFRTTDRAVLAWQITTSLVDNGLNAAPTGLETVIDAASGEILSQRQLDSKTYQPGSPEVAGGLFPRIVINNSVGPVGSRSYASTFDAVVEVDFGCSGVLVADNLVLCARHCGVGAGDAIVFGSNTGAATLFRTVQSSFLPDGFGSLLDGGDVVILTLTQPVPANVATPMRLIDETDELVGKLCSLVGYGFNGVGTSGHQFTADGFRWGGENIIDGYGAPAGDFSGENIISTDFDNGSFSANTIGSSDREPVEFEATTAPGDSGGPVMVLVGDEWVVAGVLSGGTTSTSVFGDISWWTGTAPFRSQIESRGGVFVEDLILGDLNGDGSVDLLDIGPFVDLITGGGFQEEADLNSDGQVNLFDVSPFVDLLTN